MLNTEATIGLARAAQRAGAKRFVFLSSIRAQSGPTADHVLTEDLPPRPTEAYGRSKLAAEQGLAELDLDWVALRLVLVYGAGREGQHGRAAPVRALALSAAARRARRPGARCCALDNLVAAVDTVLAAPAPLRRPLIVADPEPLTIPDMIAAHAARARPPSRPVSGADSRCSKARCGPAGEGRSMSGWRARWSPTRPALIAPGLGAAGYDARGAGGADATRTDHLKTTMPGREGRASPIERRRSAVSGSAR